MFNYIFNLIRFLLSLLFLFSGISSNGKMSYRQINASLDERHPVAMRGYIPPMNCGVVVSTAGKNAYLQVHGLNSSIFCRRVISTFDGDRSITAIDSKNNHGENKVCSIKADGFTVNVYSMDEGISLSEFLCRNFKNGLSL